MPAERSKAVYSLSQKQGRHSGSVVTPLWVSGESTLPGFLLLKLQGCPSFPRAKKKAQLTCGKKELVKVIFEGAVKKSVFALATLDVATVFETAGVWVPSSDPELPHVQFKCEGIQTIG